MADLHCSLCGERIRGTSVSALGALATTPGVKVRCAKCSGPPMTAEQAIEEVRQELEQARAATKRTRAERKQQRILAREQWARAGQVATAAPTHERTHEEGRQTMETQTSGSMDARVASWQRRAGSGEALRLAVERAVAEAPTRAAAAQQVMAEIGTGTPRVEKNAIQYLTACLRHYGLTAPARWYAAASEAHRQAGLRQGERNALGNRMLREGKGDGPHCDNCRFSGEPSTTGRCAECLTATAQARTSAYHFPRWQPKDADDPSPPGAADLQELQEALTGTPQAAPEVVTGSDSLPRCADEFVRVRIINETGESFMVGTARVLPGVNELMLPPGLYPLTGYPAGMTASGFPMAEPAEFLVPSLAEVGERGLTVQYGMVCEQPDVDWRAVAHDARERANRAERRAETMGQELLGVTELRAAEEAQRVPAWLAIAAALAGVVVGAMVGRRGR